MLSMDTQVSVSTRSTLASASACSSEFNDALAVEVSVVGSTRSVVVADDDVDGSDDAVGPGPGSSSPELARATPRMPATINTTTAPIAMIAMLRLRFGLGCVGLCGFGAP